MRRKAFTLLFFFLAVAWFTHFIVDQEGQDGALATRPDGPFARTYLKRVFQKNGVILYENRTTENRMRP